MAVDDRGIQLITFTAHTSGISDNWTQIKARKNETIQKIATRRGLPELARLIADRNDIASTRTKLRQGRAVWVPAAASAPTFSVMPAPGLAPTVTDGYARLSTLNRPGRVGLSTFDGYNPIQMSIPVLFDDVATGPAPRYERANQGAPIENDIKVLERMAGRGQFTGAGQMAPTVIRVTTYDASGDPVPLVPSAMQWSNKNQSGPLWQVAGIAWDPSPLRNHAGNRIRQGAVITVQQYVKLSLLSRSAAARAKAQPRKSKKGKKVDRAYLSSNYKATL